MAGKTVPTAQATDNNFTLEELFSELSREHPDDIDWTFATNGEIQDYYRRNGTPHSEKWVRNKLSVAAANGLLETKDVLRFNLGKRFLIPKPGYRIKKPK